MSTLPDTPEETPEELRSRSEAVRGRLLSHIDALKDRGSEIFDVAATIKRQAKRHAPLLIGVGAVALVALGAITLRSRARRRSRERRDAILYAATRLLGPAYEVRPTGQGSALTKGLRQVGKQLLAAASRELGHRALEELKLVTMHPPEDQRTTDGAVA